MVKPIVPLTFFLPGFSKCGTTSFVTMLQRHQKLKFPALKEPWFFSADDYDQRWDWYRNQFPADLSDYLAIGDDSTAYASYGNLERTADRITVLYPNARFLFLARDPAARLESGFREFHHSGPRWAVDAPFDLDEAIEALPALVQDSCYWSLISAYRARVDDERIKVVFLEDLIDRPDEVLRSSYQFLGLPALPHQPAHAAHRNKREDKLQDTRLLRRMRNTPYLGQALARIPWIPEDRPGPWLRQDRLFRKVGLRRPSAPVRWTPGALAALHDQVVPDALRFTEHYGLPQRGWRTLARLTGEDLAPAPRPTEKSEVEAT